MLVVPMAVLAVDSSNDVQKAAAVAPAVETITVRVVSKSTAGISVVLVTGQQGLSGAFDLDHSIINAGPSQPHSIRSRGAPHSLGEQPHQEKVVQLVGYPNPARVFVGSTITFKGTKSKDGLVLTWVE